MNQPSQKVIIPEDVLFQKLEDKAVILQLEKESYYGFDEVATSMWEQLREHKSVDTVVKNMMEEYAVEEEVLRKDLNNLIDTLIDLGLATLECEHE